MMAMKFNLRELFLLILVVALAFGWWVDRYIYTARAERSNRILMIRDWQATALWLWAEESAFVKSIVSDNKSITITTSDGKVNTIAVPPHIVQLQAELPGNY